VSTKGNLLGELLELKRLNVLFKPEKQSEFEAMKKYKSEIPLEGS
jgi:hypothetical protein